MTGVVLDWNGIRPLNGGRDKGFEELCSQLARSETPTEARFVRKGTPDAGVECYATLPNGSEWGWQSKYFDALGDSQWQQVDKSVKAAMEKHPRLIRYYVCIPLDVPDARIEGQRSARDRWDEHVAKWQGWATAKAMSVEFVYWGSHEMLERLARTENVGRVRFWFDKRGFDGAWFSARLDEALRTAGPRYTPEVHVELPVAQDLQAFGRTALLFDRIKALAVPLRDKLQTANYVESPVVDAEVDAAATSFSSVVQVVLDGLGSLEVQPTGPLPFLSLAASITNAGSAAEELLVLLEARERAHDATSSPSEASDVAPRRHRSNPFRDRRFRVGAVAAELRRANEELRRADRLAGNALLLMRGAAGTGKTHLLCDIARTRIAQGQLTVLLMGQRFVSNDAPWTQALQQLDLPGLSAEEFVGALEAAAHASGQRALLMIDAINEGAGRSIWPSHMSAFLAQVERSAWIGVVLSVRTSYEELVVPVEVRERSALVAHHGFREHEYDATKTFFVHYGLELPSTPLLAPEFRNPLFLKTLCLGLHAKGERRLPRGLHGISAVLDLYLAAVNERLAQQLGFDRRTPLVRRAMDAVTAALVDSGDRWLTLERASAVVDALLPGREFERSLFRGLVVEGVLAEEAPLHADESRRDIVYVAYERFADHLVATTLLDRHLDPADASAAFRTGGGLSFVGDIDGDVAPGLLEALFVQVAERCGQELATLVPKVAERWNVGEAFRQSLVWRAVTAFSDATREALSSLCHTEHDLHETLDVLLTLATLPQHPLNACFLDKRLRKDSMAERDAWWSTYLHGAWGSHGAVDRLVDWASTVVPETDLGDDTVELAGTALAWMLTSSNRFLRDRATKALVSLLTGRLDAAARLVGGLADCDDPYVTERIYAVAYGVAMRSSDPVATGRLAASVYERVFEGGNPPAHLLLRDYARGVVERAIHLGAQIAIDPTRIRPPYSSEWPTIPSEEDVKPFLADWSKGSHDSGELDWARNRIASSVLDDDFARYVIGTNSAMSGDWLSITLAEPPWEPPPTPKELLSRLMEDLSELERSAWERFAEADEAFEEQSRSFVAKWFSERDDDGAAALPDPDSIAAEVEKARTPELTAAEAARSDREPPRLELRQLQRYILKRVFDLGWTTKRFGHFDRFSIGNEGRDASKAERIGKKYQWIAYFEILALVADRFQYRERYREAEGDKAYEGPWQAHVRDIDPSCTLRSTKGGTSWSGHSAGWWGQAQFDAWGDPGSERTWVLRSDDLPKVEDLLVVTNPQDGQRWLNAQGYFGWKQRAPADRAATEVERGELWYLCTGYLIRQDDTEAFLKWAEGVDFWGRWMPDPAVVYGAFLGEHAWAPASRYFEWQYYGDDGWTQPAHGCPVKLRTAAFEYLREASGFDCSVDESYTLRLPVRELVTRLGVRWSGGGADFVDASGRLAAQDPTAIAPGPSALLLRAELLQELRRREGLTLCWAMLGEKRILGTGFGGRHHPALRMSGAYVLGDSGVAGFMKRVLDDPDSAPPAPRHIDTYRSRP